MPKGDFTRSTFDPRKHYSSVRMQQGRVQLDADWNEQMDILGHRVETETVDVIGRCGFPKHAPGFQIQELPGDLRIGAGRGYVDGILCELEEEVTFKTQPHLPNAAGLLENPSAGAYFAYLDVWRRHVTAVEDGSIREVALGGPDTATRLQTIWQVKLVKVGDTAGDLTCESEPDAWKKLIAPPTGKLRARTRPVEDEDNPCIVPASAGYTRLENQLYRVEVHKGGTLSSPPAANGPTFKWSRDNGSIATEWLSQDSLDGNKLTVQSTGRDSLLRFEDEGWLELTDDARELLGVPGEMRQANRVEGDVIEIHPVLGDPVDINEFSPVRKARRWDSAGALPIEQAADNDGYLPLEGGIEIRFEPGTYETGDYWLIPARAFIGDIEWPEDGATPRALPPHGVDHHFCKLGIVEVAADGSFEVLSDCRDIFPPLTEIEGGCCDIVVHPGESIQAAIDSLPEEGGAVCLKAGVHEIIEEVRIQRSHVSLCGCPGAQVVRRNGIFLVEVSGIIEQVTIEGIRFEVADADQAGGAPGGAPFLTPALITVEDCNDFALRHCVLAVAGVQGQPQVPVAVAAGVVANNAARMDICGNEMRRVTLGVVVLHSTRVEICGNTMEGPVEILGTGSDVLPGGELGVWIDNVFGGRHRIECNWISNFWTGVQIGTDGVEGGASIIAGNEIVRVAATGVSTGEMRFAIDVMADQCVVRDNRINLPSSLCGGIQVIGLEARIEDNLLESDAPGPLGIRLGRPGEDSDLSSDSGVIRGNRLTGPQLAIWVERSRAVEVIHNVMEGSADQPMTTGVFLNRADEARVTGNRIVHAEVGIDTDRGQGFRLLDNQILDGDTGLRIDQAIAIEVSRNQVERMKSAGLVAVGLFLTAAFSWNRFAFCAYDAPFGFALGILFALAEVKIEGCEIVDTGVAPDFATSTPLTWGVFGLFITDCRIHGNLIGYSTFAMPNPAAEHRAIGLLGGLEFKVSDNFTLGGSALLLDNKLRGPGRSALVELPEFPVIKDRLTIRFSRVTFSNNDCFHFSADERAVTVSLTGSHGIVVGNHIQSVPLLIPVHFHGMRGVYVGNSTLRAATGFTELPAPQGDFNID